MRLQCVGIGLAVLALCVSVGELDGRGVHFEYAGERVGEVRSETVDGRRVELVYPAAREDDLLPAVCAATWPSSS